MIFNEVWVTSKSEKRAFDRISIPGAIVTYRKQNKLGFLESFSRPMPLFNLTKSGVCFAADKQLDKGEPLCIDIKIPGEEKLRLYGKIRWINNDSPVRECLIGAQFTAFGKGSDYNSLKSLDRLRLMQKKYGTSTE
jgi:hypothetical protein